MCSCAAPIHAGRWSTISQLSTGSARHGKSGRAVMRRQERRCHEQQKCQGRHGKGCAVPDQTGVLRVTSWRFHHSATGARSILWFEGILVVQLPADGVPGGAGAMLSQAHPHPPPTLKRLLSGAYT